MPKSFNIDAFDRALLELVRRNNLTPAHALASQVGLSESAVLRRLRQLRRDGVIAADVAILNPEAFGSALTMHVHVTMERESSAVLDAFTRKVKQRPEVRHAWYVAGDIDFVLQIEVASMEAFDTFSREVLNDDPNVRAFRTTIAIRQIVDATNACLPPL